jgi:acetyltransferase-like isoleucine patch superfamily enzyme
MPVRDVEGFEHCICHDQSLVNLYECEIGEGTKIGAFVEIGRGVRIGDRCKIQSHVYIPEGVQIGDSVFIGPGAVFTNSKYPMRGKPYDATIVEDDAVIGANATILPGVTIGAGAIVGAGAVVTRDVKPLQTVMGNPAK